MVPFCLLILLTGCGEKNDTVEPPSDPVAEGWAAFEAGDYATASARFQAAIGEDAGDVEAYNGLGWASAKLDSLVDATESFDQAIARGHAGADPHAGRALVLRDLEPVDYGQAIDAATMALGIDSQYRFSHDTSLDWRDLRLVIAHSRFQTGDYDLANTEVGQLGGTMPDSASPTYVADLLAEIERLTELYGN